MLDAQFRTVLDALADTGAVPLVRGTAQETRAHYRGLSMARRGPGFVPEPVAQVRDEVADGVPVRIYVPVEDRGRVVTFLHGGGWVVGDLDTHDPVCRRMANALGAVVVAVDYRLAPEHPFPAPLDDCVAALAWTARTWPDHALGVAGDSAGASLAAGAALRARDANLPLAGQMLFYPATDPSCAGASHRENAEGYFLTAADMDFFYRCYLPAGAASAPEIDLLHADVAGVAPAVVATAEFDPLRDDGAAYAERLRAADVPVTYLPGPGLIHGFVAFLGVVDAADARGAEALAAFADLLGTVSA